MRNCGPGSKQEITKISRTCHGFTSNRRARAAHTPAITRPLRGRTSSADRAIGRAYRCGRCPTRTAARTLLDELELGADLDAALEASRHRARSRVEPVDPLGLLSPVLGHLEPVADGDAADNQHLVLELDVADRLDVVLLGIDLDLTRFQRAGEGAGQSPAGGGDDVVECGRAGR